MPAQHGVSHRSKLVRHESLKILSLIFLRFGVQEDCIRDTGIFHQLLEIGPGARERLTRPGVEKLILEPFGDLPRSTSSVRTTALDRQAMKRRGFFQTKRRNFHPSGDQVFWNIFFHFCSRMHIQSSIDAFDRLIS